MSAHAFRICSVRYGGKLVRGVEARCGKCGFSDQKPAGQTKGFAPSDEREILRFRQMFERDGWEVGSRPQDDRCRRCVAAAKAEKRKNFKVVPTQEKPVMSVQTHVPAPREMSREDGRLIYAKLEDVYSADGKGYTPGWTDEKVATDLGVPRGWIEKVRKEFFGAEAGNPAIYMGLDDARKLVEEAKKLNAKFTETKAALGNLIAEAQKLNSRAETIERRIAEISKAVRP